jgi:hypothetical protein
MKRFAVSCFLTVAAGFAASNAVSAKTEFRVSKRVQNIKERPGFIFLEKDVGTGLQELSTDLISDSEKALEQKNYGEAAADLKAAARTLRLSAQPSSLATSQTQLVLAADDLDHIAMEVRGESIKSMDALNVRLASSYYHTAEFHRLRAVDEWSRHDLKHAGYDMVSAAQAIDKGSKWVSHEMKSDGEATVGVRVVARKLIEGTSWNMAEVGKGLSILWVETERLGENVTWESSGPTSGITSAAGESATK